jgi:hypothetical protein
MFASNPFEVCSLMVPMALNEYKSRSRHNRRQEVPYVYAQLILTSPCTLDGNNVNARIYNNNLGKLLENPPVYLWITRMINPCPVKPEMKLSVSYK